METFPSGWTPAVKDCFGLHGHSAFGSVAKHAIVDLHVEGFSEYMVAPLGAIE